MKTYKLMVYDFSQFNKLEIYALSDMHVNSREFAEPLFQRLSRHILAEENRYLVIGGDILDSALKGSKSDVYEARMNPREEMAYAVELLYPLRHRVLGGTSGNHENRHMRETGTDVLEIVFAKLGIADKYKQRAFFFRVDMGNKRSVFGGGHRPKYSVGVMHGNGGGSLLGSGINRTGSLAPLIGVDLLITGHTHVPAAGGGIRYQLHNNLLVPRPYKVMVGTGWLEYDGYPLEKALKPTIIKPNHAILHREEFQIDVLS